MKCKYCGAAAETRLSDDDRSIWECGTLSVSDGGGVIRSDFCLKQSDKNELARYRAMFPVAPWSTEPITLEVCERLGMARTESDVSAEYKSHRMGVEFGKKDPSPYVYQEDDEMWYGCDYVTKAGQLSCLIAARKTTTDEQPGD